MPVIKMSKYYFEKDFTIFDEYIKSFCVQKQHYLVGDIISAQADTLNKGYYITQGIMKLSIGLSDGNEKTLALFGPGSIFPLGINEHHYALEYAIEESALTPIVAYEFSFLELRRMFLNNSNFALRMMEHYCDFTSFLFYEISSLTSNSAVTKVANILYALASNNVFENNIIPLAQHDIASLAGTSKVQIARVYKFLKDNNMIDISRNQIKILDLEKLRSFNEFDTY